MTAIAKVLFRGTEEDVEAFQNVAIFCGGGLLASLLMLLRGVDLTVGFP